MSLQKGMQKRIPCSLTLPCRRTASCLHDAELAKRGKEQAVLIKSEEVMEQVRQLIDSGLIVRRLMMSRCSLCNTVLREATEQEINAADYAPRIKKVFVFFWCEA